MQKLTLIFVVLSVALVGCNSGSTPIETTRTQGQPGPQTKVQGNVPDTSTMPKGAQDALRRNGVPIPN